MNNYIKINQDRWNNVKNDYTEPLTHEELEEVRNNPISVALTVGKKVPKEWFEKATGKKILGLACGGGQQGPVFAIKGYDVTIMDFSKSSTYTFETGLKIMSNISFSNGNGFVISP